ncbi:MAG: NADH/ubiquinone/plastoquinone (complex I) [Candidatus Omnitrophota bacterium]|nr:MAG: NADH/ubiquinone/plastoquinone (complex I) [Candidatus Omnitrophota bacterium]
MHILPLFPALGLGGAFLVSLLGRRSKKFCDIFTNVITCALFGLSLYSLCILKSQTSPLVYKVGGWIPPIGISLVLDGLSSFMLIIVNFVAFMITLYSVNYMEKFTAKFKFYTLFLLMLAGMNGVIVTGDIFNLFVFLEIASVASYALVAYGVEAEELEASFKYLIMSSVASLFILLGIAFLYSYASTLNMADIAVVLSEKGLNNAMLFASILFIVGFSLKAAIVPFHAWLPDAHPSAPAPISACLSGIFIKALGVYTLCRLFYNVFGANPALLNLFMGLGAVSIVVGALLALGQVDFKRLLAYSSINQIGYIILGLGLGTPLGILGALFHLFNHSVFKSLLFLNSGAVEYTVGTRNIRDMGGLREKMPVTSSTSLIASMSISGIPPFNGFFSKLIIILACIHAGHVVYSFWAILGSILTLAYFMKLQKNVFFGNLPERYNNVREVPFFMKTAMVMLAIACIVGGFMVLPKVKKYILSPAQNVLTHGLDYKNINEIGVK